MLLALLAEFCIHTAVMQFAINLAIFTELYMCVNEL